jgi:phenylalanyl-tRNA synthetase beta chain
VVEKWKLACLLSGPRFAQALRSERGEVDFYDMKAIFDQLFADLGCRGVRYQPLKGALSRPEGENLNTQLSSLFHPGQSVQVLAGPSEVGFVGLLHPRKAKELKVRAPLWIAELDWEALSIMMRGAFAVPTFRPWSEFPAIERDFALLVRDEVTADKICQVALKSGRPLIKSANIFDFYRGSQVPEGMTSVAVRVIFYSEGRSLLETEAERASAQIIESWKKELRAELRS